VTLRPFTWLFVFWVLQAVWHGFVLPGAHELYAASSALLVRAFDVVLGLAVWSWLLGWMLGSTARQAIGAFWIGLARGVGAIISGVWEIVYGLIRSALARR